MAYRTTIKTLRTLINTLNDVAGMPTKRSFDGNRDIGMYVLDCAYGGYRLCRIVRASGGERDITPRYPAGVAADLIRAYMRGLQDAKINTTTARAAYEPNGDFYDASSNPPRWITAAERRRSESAA